MFGCTFPFVIALPLTATRWDLSLHIEEPQVLSQSADHGQHALVDVPQGWGGVNHTADIIKVIMACN